jgi:hypothetical protein
MPMPWNTIDVPLETGWQCTLMPERQYDRLMEWGDGYNDLSARWLYPRAEDDFWYSIWNTQPPGEEERVEQWDRNRLRQLADDKAAFAHLFRPVWDFRTMTGRNSLRDLKMFLRDSLNIVHWNMPKDNAGIRRILCKAVAENRLIPIIDRDYEGLPRVALPDPVPLRWPSAGSGGGSAYPQEIISYPEFAALQRANGELPDASAAIANAGISTTIDPMPNLGAAASRGGGFDWLGATETVADAVFGGDDDSAGDDDALDEGLSGAHRSTPLGDAQPFDYVPDSLSDETEELAASTNDPNYAAKMLGYNRKIFGNMVHAMKDEMDLRGDDNVIWHDNGDVEFNGDIIDNMHSYAP